MNFHIGDILFSRRQNTKYVYYNVFGIITGKLKSGKFRVQPIDKINMSSNLETIDKSQYKIVIVKPNFEKFIIGSFLIDSNGKKCEENIDEYFQLYDNNIIINDRYKEI